MRGPGHKTALDVRRTWKCSACGRERRLMGDITTMICDCREGGVFMTITSEKIVAPRPYQPLSQEDVRSSAFGIDDLPVLVPHPNSLPPEPTSPRRPRPGSDHAASKTTSAGPDDSVTEAPADVETPGETRPLNRQSPTGPKAEGTTNKEPAISSPSTTPPATKPAPQTEPDASDDEEWGAGIL